MITTKYSQTQNRIIEYIAKKNIRKGEVLPTEKKMAELFGVSIITVRKAVSNLEAEKVVRREQGRGTFLQMDLMEKKPANGELLFLDIISKAPDSRVPIHFPWFKETEDLLRQYGWNFSSLVTSGKPDAVTLKRMRGVRGIIGTNLITAEWIHTLRSLNIPTVIMGAIGTPPEGIPIVTFDYEKMTRLLAEELLSHGGRKFALIPGGQDYIPAQQMVQALTDFLAENGIGFSEEQVCYSKPESPGSAIRWTNDFLEANPDVDAFLVESEAFIPMLASLYNSPRRPLVGILSTRPRFSNFCHNTCEAVFEENIAEKSLSILLKLINGDKVPKAFKIAPQKSSKLL
jgi:hypothetical protein